MKASATPEQLAQMEEMEQKKQEYKNMTDEEKAAMKAQKKAEWENMTDEERKAKK